MVIRFLQDTSVEKLVLLRVLDEEQKRVVTFREEAVGARDKDALIPLDRAPLLHWDSGILRDLTR